MAMGAAEAKKLIRRLLTEGLFVVTKHARDEMAKDGLTNQDAINVLRGGIICEPEYENGSWRYHARTPRMTFVVEIDPEPEVAKSDDVDAATAATTELVVVTAWRAKQ